MVTLTDLFCGAGGSSTGAVQVPGVRVVIAANHWQLACDVHNLNHPTTDHAAVDLHQEDPGFFPRTDVLWASPECTKWSQAGGTRRPAIEEGLFEDPLSDEASHRSRLLMFDVLKFAEHHRYRAMVIENVVDIATQDRYRLAWYEWRRQLTSLGYRHRVVSLNSMHAQTFGPPAPQSRDRIYIVCWREGERTPDLDRILRPAAHCPACRETVHATQSWKNAKIVGRYRQTYLYTHADCGTVVEPGWLPAATAIDWTIPGDRVGDRLRPKTRARIAAGIARYWSPLTIEATRAEIALAQPPFLAELYGTSTARPVTAPAGTFTAGGNHHALVAPYYGAATHARPASDPIGTLTTVDRYALVTPAGGSWNDDARPATDPLRTLTSRDAYALVTRHYGARGDQSYLTTPVGQVLRTLTATGGNMSLVRADTAPGRPPVTPADLAAAEELVSEVLFRMFRPHEVAAGMAFPADYRWDAPGPAGRLPSSRDLVKMAGNAVTPPSARDILAVVVEAITGEDVALSEWGWAA